MGITYEQANQLLGEGSRIMKAKHKSLSRGARFYFALFVFNFGLIATLSATLIALDSVSLVAKGSTRTYILIFGLILQVTLALVTALQNVISPKSQSKQCSNIAKDYSNLDREVMLQIAANENEFVIDGSESEVVSDTLFERLMYYSSEAQNINEQEPLLVFIGHIHKSAVDAPNSMPPPDVAAGSPYLI